MPHLLKSAMKRAMHPDGLSPIHAMHPDGLMPAAMRKAAPSLGGKSLPKRNVAPSVSMPTPSHLAPRTRASNFSAGKTMAGIGLSAGIGAITGGVYAGDGTAGGAVRGAMTGAMGGAVLGAMGGVGLPTAVKAGLQNKTFVGQLGSYSTTAIRASDRLNSAEGRNALFAAGGLLGGAVFSSGASSKKRGFNSNRGTSFSR